MKEIADFRMKLANKIIPPNINLTLLGSLNTEELQKVVEEYVKKFYETPISITLKKFDEHFNVKNK